jgi:hypothetical protein
VALPSFQPYSPEALPEGFRYPADFLALSTGVDHADIFPWVFIDSRSDVGKLAYQMRKHDGRNLVPFASVEDDRKDIACFDGDDKLGTGRVLMLILDDSGRAYSYATFEEWLEAAKADACRWKGVQ